VLSSPDALDPQAVARTLEPVEATLLRLLLERPYLRTLVADRLSVDDFTTTPARELWRAIDTQPIDGFERSKFADGLEPTLEAVARTLFASVDPLPDEESMLGQAVEQSLVALERTRISELLDFKRAELAEAEAASDEAVSGQLRRDVLELQARRLDLDRRREDTSLLTKRRQSRDPKPIPQPATTGGT
jgi:hypothetical protein